MRYFCHWPLLCMGVGCSSGPCAITRVDVVTTHQKGTRSDMAWIGESRYRNSRVQINSRSHLIEFS